SSPWRGAAPPATTTAWSSRRSGWKRAWWVPLSSRSSLLPGAEVVPRMPLSVCATPIGTLDDITVRVVRELAESDLVLCEDTRRTRLLLRRHGITARLLSYHRHNEARRTGEVLRRLSAAERIALVSDAGLPGINDPGAR